MKLNKYFTQILAAIAAYAVSAGAAVAQTATGQPVPWQLGFQPAATPVMADVNEFHNVLLIVITLISLFVLGLLVYVMVRFNARANPTPSRVTHNTVVEVAWTVIPALILVAIAIPSFKLLYKAVEVPAADITIKAIGSQWYWTYEYPDDGFTFDALMLDESELEEGQPRLLATDNPVVVPAGKIVHMQVTAMDVIHAWTVPAFGSKIDAVAGRLNETWFQVDEPGTYYGQCSELCGAYHAFMPIEVRVVTEAEYQDWLDFAREEFARLDGAGETVMVADADER